MEKSLPLIWPIMVLWIFGSYYAALLAERGGWRFARVFYLSLIISPIVGIICVKNAPSPHGYQLENPVQAVLLRMTQGSSTTLLKALTVGSVAIPAIALLYHLSDPLVYVSPSSHYFFMNLPTNAQEYGFGADSKRYRKSSAERAGYLRFSEEMQRQAELTRKQERQRETAHVLDRTDQPKKQETPPSYGELDYELYKQRQSLDRMQRQLDSDKQEALQDFEHASTDLINELNRQNRIREIEGEYAKGYLERNSR